jgi:ribonuclease HI
LIQKDKNEHCIHLFTDSRYVKDGMTVWRHNWKRNGWQTSQKKPVKNRDLWEKLDHLTESLTLEWHWVKAHSAHPENERVDGLARAQSLM